MTSSVRVAVLDDYQGVALAMADWGSSPVPLELDPIREHIDDQELLVERLRDAEVVVAMRERTPLPASLQSRLPKLRLVVTAGARNAAIEPAVGVTLCGTSILTSPTVELTWALILAHRRHLVTEAMALRDGRWQTTLGEGLENSTFGLLGLGSIGTRVARVAQAFGMRVVAWSQNLTAARAAEEGVEAVALPHLLGMSDVVSIHLRLSERTRGLVGVHELAAMRPEALLVNTSRAAIVDRDALADALHNGGIGGAAIDVFEQEPVDGSAEPLLRAPRTLLSPHLGYVVRQNYELFFRDALEDIVAFYAGDPVRLVDA